MGSVADRIETSSIGVEYIELNEVEYPHYHGMGNAVVYFDDDAVITGIDDIDEVEEDGAKALVDKAMICRLLPRVDAGARRGRSQPRRAAQDRAQPFERRGMGDHR